MSDQPGASPTSPMGEGALAARTVIGAAWLLTWRMASRSLGLVSTLILARVLVPADFGIVAMATTFATIIDALSHIGVQDALVRRIDDGHNLYDTAFTLQVGRGVITSVIVAAAAPAASWWFNEPRLVPMLLVLAGASLLSGFENIGIVEFRRLMRYDLLFRLLIVPRIVSVAVAIPMALQLQSYWALLIATVVAKLARTVMTYMVHSYRPRLRLSGWRELAGFSFWVWAASLARLAWDRVDPFVLGPLLGPTQVGLYLLALELASLPITEIVEPVADALFAGFSQAQKGGRSSVHHAPLVAATLVMFIMPLMITISCASGYVVAALLGPRWASADTPIAILAWLCLFSPLSWVCSAVLIANGFVRRDFVGKVIASLVRLAVLTVAVSMTERLDFIAAAITVCVAVESCAYLLLLKGLGKVRLGSVTGALARTLLAGALVVLLLHQAGLAWQEVSMPSLSAFFHVALIGVLVTALYVAFVLALWFLAGRPTGPETRLFDLTGGYVRPLVLRFSR